MNAANLDKSKRLQKALKFLKSYNNRPKSTMQIIQCCQVCAVNSIISELRQNGHKITCNRKGDYYYYKLEG